MTFEKFSAHAGSETEKIQQDREEALLTMTRMLASPNIAMAVSDDAGNIEVYFLGSAQHLSALAASLNESLAETRQKAFGTEPDGAEEKALVLLQVALAVGLPYLTVISAPQGLSTIYRGPPELIGVFESAVTALVQDIRNAQSQAGTAVKH